MNGQSVISFEAKHGRGSVLRLLADVRLIQGDISGRYTYQWLADKWGYSKPALWRRVNTLFDFPVVLSDETVRALRILNHIDQDNVEIRNAATAAEGVKRQRITAPLQLESISEFK